MKGEKTKPVDQPHWAGAGKKGLCFPAWPFKERGSNRRRGWFVKEGGGVRARVLPCVGGSDLGKGSRGEEKGEGHPQSGTLKAVLFGAC